MAIVGLLERDQEQRLTLDSLLAVSDAVQALAVPADEPSHTVYTPTELLTPRTLELSQRTHGTSNDLSPVSMATTESGYGSDPSEAGAADIVASLCGIRRPVVQEQGTTGLLIGRIMPPWQGSQAVVQARTALNADVDDPEELQLALAALERETPDVQGPWTEAFESLSCELRVRIAALRADAAALLQSLLDVPAIPQCMPSPGDSPWLERTALMGAGCSPIAEDGAAVDTVTTVCMTTVKNMGNVEALESAIELATSLGVDTSPAEERAACTRGLLSVRIVWGTFARFFLLPLGVSFSSLLAEVSRRFGLPPSIAASAVSTSGRPSFELYWREGPELFSLIDQSSWELCLQRKGLYARPGRLDLRLEAVPGVAPLLGRRVRTAIGPGAYQTPFVVTGTRLPRAPPGIGSAASADNPINPKVSPLTLMGRGGRLPRPTPVGNVLCGRHRGKRLCGGSGGSVPVPAYTVSAAVVGSPAPTLRSASGVSGAGGWGVRRSNSRGPTDLALQLEGRGAQNVRRGGHHHVR
jgi:hypothetical protein